MPRDNFTSEAFKNRVDGATRRLVIAALGWSPEDSTDPSDRYVASCGEMLRYLRETDPALADQITTTRDMVLEPYRAAQLDKLFGKRS